MRRLFGAFSLLALCALSGEVLAQGGLSSGRPNAAPLDSMQRARSYALTNRSSQTIVGAHLRMTNGHERDLTWDQPVRPQQGRDIAVPSSDCLAVLTVQFNSGKTMQSGAPDCRQNHIIVTDDAVQIGSSASDRPPVN